MAIVKSTQPNNHQVIQLKSPKTCTMDKTDSTDKNTHHLAKPICELPITPPTTPKMKLLDDGDMISNHNEPKQVMQNEVTISAQHLHNHTLNADFNAQYSLGQELGSGGYGFVVSALQLVTGREVAVKFIFRHKIPANKWAHDPKLGIIPMEIYILRHVHHPNIIEYIDQFQDEQFFYLVMELHGTGWSKARSNTMSKASLAVVAEATTRQLEESGAAPRPSLMSRRSSCDLFECIEQHSKFTEDQARKIIKQIVDCIHYLYSRGICHRDLKDENIVIDSNFEVKLIDFGSAVVLPRQRNHYFDRFYGTISFASPEILMGNPYRAEPAEVWSLGILLYTILYGEVPFNDPAHAISRPFTAPRVQSSPDCMHLLSWMLAKKADERARISEVVRHPWLKQQQ